MNSMFLELYRKIPWFKGKLILGKKLFKKHINRAEEVAFRAHNNIFYHLPNTIENIGIELIVNGIYERNIVQFLKDRIPDNSVYFDIGANIGSLGLPVLKYKKNIHYYGFEASPMVFHFLQKNMEVNRIQEYTLTNKLVHKNSNQSMKFYHSKFYGKSSLAPTYSHESIMVNSISIDHYCLEQKIEHIDWMKVDVEGFELYVFEGMENMLRFGKIQNILFEFEGWAEEAAGLKAGTALNYLKKTGYELFDLKGQSWVPKPNETMIWAKPKVA